MGYPMLAQASEAPRSGRDPDGRGRDRVTGSSPRLKWQHNRERGGLHTKGPITDCCEVTAPSHHEDGYATRNRL